MDRNWMESCWAMYIFVWTGRQAISIWKCWYSIISIALLYLHGLYASVPATQLWYRRWKRCVCKVCKMPSWVEWIGRESELNLTWSWGWLVVRGQPPPSGPLHAEFSRRGLSWICELLFFSLRLVVVASSWGYVLLVLWVFFFLRPGPSTACLPHNGRNFKFKSRKKKGEDTILFLFVFFKLAVDSCNSWLWGLTLPSR